MRPTGLGSGIDKDRADYTVCSGGWGGPVCADSGRSPSPRMSTSPGLLLREGAGVFLHVVAIILLGIFLGGVIVGIVAAAILFSLRRDRRSPPFRVPRKEDD